MTLVNLPKELYNYSSMKDPNCVFCKIINKEIPVTPVFEDEDIIAINDIRPKAPVHVLVIPKKHITNLDDVEENNAEILSKILLTAKKMAKEKAISGQYKVTTNIGEMAGQTVFHMHFHVIGGWENKEAVVSELNIG